MDTREQKPLPFKIEGYITEIRKVKLDVGDYGCLYQDGSQSPLYFERKSIPDLFGTLGKGHHRFKREIERSKKANATLVLLIEGTLSDVYRGLPQSEVKGESVVKKLMTLWMKYDILPVFMPNRLEMVEFVRECYEAIGRLEKA